jgi:hypothetical protein
MYNQQPKYDAFVVTGEGERALWTKIGAAWETKSGNGLVLQLQATPLDGRINLQPFKPPKREEG